MASTNFSHTTQDKSSIPIEQNMVNINVGGKLFTTTYSNLKTVPDTRLSAVSQSSKDYIAAKEFYFFDRNPEIFSYILDYYRTGELHLPKQICGASIRNELEFWQIPTTSIADCCVSSLFKYEDELELTKNLRQQFEAPSMEYTPAQLQASKWNRIKSPIWKVLDQPNSSTVAKIYSVIYMSFVALTCVLFILSSHKSFRTKIDDVIQVNATTTMTVHQYLSTLYGNSKVVSLGSTRELYAIEILNYICTIFFAVELSLRFITCPARREMSKNWLNIVDLLIVLSLVTSFGLSMKRDFYTSSHLLWASIIVRGFILLRLLRLFRFAKHFTGLKVVYLALRASLKELGLLCITFIITTSLFGATIYYVEFATEGDFESVLIGIWWATVTLTTIGYGDYVPTVPAGYVIGAICGMCGLLLLSMPIAIIATNFNDYYTQNKVREKQIQRKKHIMKTLKTLFKGRQTAPLVIDNMDSNTENTNAVNSNGTKPHSSVALNRFRQIAVKAAKS